MTVVSINQPAYLPWLGYFSRIQQSDIHVFLDHVSMGKDGMFTRNLIRTPQGSQLLRVPVRNRGDDTPISQIMIADDGKWRRQHLAALKQNYARAPFYDRHIKFFEAVYAEKWHTMAALVQMITIYMINFWNIETPLRHSCIMKNATGTKTELNLNLCKEVGATKYISGAGGRDYLDVAKFEAAGIEVEFQDYKHPVYKQCWPGFESHMSGIDALFNCEGFPT